MENFPELEFSIVHGGFAFTEETAWPLARFPNVDVCLEVLIILLDGNPDSFERILAEMIKIVGPQACEDMYWSSAVTAFRPQLQLEVLRDFEVSEEAREYGYRSRKPQIAEKTSGKSSARTTRSYGGLTSKMRRSASPTASSAN